MKATSGANLRLSGLMTCILVATYKQRGIDIIIVIDDVCMNKLLFP